MSINTSQNSNEDNERILSGIPTRDGFNVMIVMIKIQANNVIWSFFQSHKKVKKRMAYILI